MENESLPSTPFPPPQPIEMQTLEYPLWDDQRIDVCRDEEIAFFWESRPKPPVRTSPLAGGMLGSPCEFLLKSVRVDFLSRMPEPILDEIANQVTVNMGLGVRSMFDLPLSIANRILTSDEKPQRCWRLKVPETKIPPLTHVSVRLLHTAIRDDIEPFKVRLYLEGDLTCPRF